ncbi:MAG: coenzyme F420-0:L-glutamate ligase [Solirubrobacteraceae bacterium]|nr:coenzyme F420-0:L-glutamate ligase [Solirubrobacteraceae bacterium]
MAARAVRITSLTGLPEIAADDDLAAVIAHHADGVLQPGAVVCVAQKLVSKAQGRVRQLAQVAPSARAQELAASGAGRGNPRLVQVILDESAEVLRAERGILICRTHHGLVCANAGVDQSNAARPGDVVLLPEDPDGAARALKAELERLTGAQPLGVLISDSFGRAWRLGQVDVAIGLAGIDPLDAHEGRVDRAGRPLVATMPAVADELAAAAGLARTKAGGDGVVIVDGSGAHVSAADGPGAAALLRALDEDLFR